MRIDIEGARKRGSEDAGARGDAESERRYRAMESRDERFRGRFVAAVTSTGIYCRPGCPARTPKRENVRFYLTAADARRGGFRPCKRCDPDGE